MGRLRSPKVAKISARLSSGSPRVETDFVGITNRKIAEFLVLEGEKMEGYKRKAFFRAGHAAFLWPEEAVVLQEQNRSLVELPGVGPFLAKVISGWIEKPPEPLPLPPPIRRNFLTLTEAHSILAGRPEWRSKLRGDLQMHTEWSDGSAPIRDMVESAIGRGYEYIAITDHTKGLKIAGGIDEKELARQADEITSLNAELIASRNFSVLRSVELNLSPLGEGDLDCAFLNGLDVVLGSFHSQLRVTTDQTERYLAAIENPCLHILGHPRGRVYNYRPGLQADWRRIFARAAELDKAVEIDGYPDRQDLDVELLQIAREEGVRISFGSDAHHPWQLLFLDLSLAAAILAGIPPHRIVNFMSATELVAWAGKVRQRN
jgi:histidinol phosphatase-like PHP family hydrolase